MDEKNISFTFREMEFKRPAGTSRGILISKPSWFVKFQEGGQLGYGEVSLIPGLSPDDRGDVENTLHALKYGLIKWPNASIIPERDPALYFGLEMAEIDLKSTRPGIMYESNFSNGTSGIPINGLVWMGDFDFMNRQIRQKIDEGFTCLKLKIGAHEFEDELHLIQKIRRQYTPEDIELRVDANGAFSSNTVMDKLNQLSECDIHSIEQPIAARQWDKMAELCRISPIDIALDEELIGVPETQMENLLKTIEPQYIILKPSLLGGFEKSNQWISVAEQLNIGWWATSALESNLGLTAIAQWVSTKNNPLPQGLGTGLLFTNNLKSSLSISQGTLYFKPDDEVRLSLSNLFN